MRFTRKRLLILLAIVAVAAAVVFVNLYFTRNEGKEVTVEAVRKRDLEAVVSASGKIQPKRSVNISADTMGRVTELAVNEGDVVRRGQFLLQIDPRNLESNYERVRAALAASEAQLEQLRTNVETAKASLELARENLRRQRDLWAEQLTTREALDRAETEFRLREKELLNATQQVATQQARIREQRAVLESARYDLSKVRIESPIDGIVTRRNIELGETVVIGTMNNPGTVLLTIADMSVIEAEVEVDETDIPFVKIGQPAKVTIDALPGQEFTGKVTEIGNSPIQVTGVQAGTQATNFKVKVTLDTQIADVRPGFTCSAEITTATRQQVLAVPIQAMVVREMVLDEKDQIVRVPRTERRRRGVTPKVAAEELPPGQKRKELEGVFVFRDGVAEFVPVRTGIAGEKYFEVLSGLEENVQVITGPFASVRDLQDGDKVRLQKTTGPRTS